MDETVTLDRQTFKVLASETRVGMLKLLAQRRMTLTELATRLGLAPSSVKEHLDALVASGLIAQADEGHKWKYYALTEKGKDILHPAEKRVFILLGLGLVIGIASLASLAANLPASERFAATDLVEIPQVAAPATTLPGALPEDAPDSAPFPTTTLSIALAALIIAGGCAGYLLGIRRGVRFGMSA
ncbi:MAG: winged helix-turn-helix transcriptional regulator [Candidatus Aenigmarchaeota archaeon]|nr:winged helix-turn-helix transcriptional regulator [Candidatus Aenigmarchaeota archaeon]